MERLYGASDLHSSNNFGYIRVSQKADKPGIHKESAIDYNFTVHETLPEFEREYQGLQRLEI